MIYVFDIDGTICKTYKDRYEESTPIIGRIRRINRLKKTGHTITLYTARGTVTGTDWRALTERQLSEWGVQYSNLIFGKPHGDYYIDDKGIQDIAFFK